MHPLQERRPRGGGQVTLALLIGPLAFGRISTIAAFEYRSVAVVAVDGFLAAFAKDAGLSAPSTESEGA